MASKLFEPSLSLLGVLKWIALLFFFTLLVDLTVAFFAGSKHLKDVLEQDLGRIAQFDRNGAAYDRAVGTANTLYRWVYVDSGIDAVAQGYAHRDPFDPEREDGRTKTTKAAQIPDHILARLYAIGWPAIQSAMLGLQLYGVRLGVAASLLPLIALVLTTVAFDGYGARLVRRWRVGRESSHRYNLSKATVHTGIIGFSVYLMLPVSLDPRAILFPAIALWGVLTWQMFAYYKKYL